MQVYPILLIPILSPTAGLVCWQAGHRQAAVSLKWTRKEQSSWSAHIWNTNIPVVKEQGVGANVLLQRVKGATSKSWHFRKCCNFWRVDSWRQENWRNFKLKSLRLPSCESRTKHTVCAYAALKVGQTQTIPFVRVTDLFLGRLQGIWWGSEGTWRNWKLFNWE